MTRSANPQRVESCRAYGAEVVLADDVHEAFKLADNVLHMGVRGVTDLMVMPGLINLDFADIRAVMTEMGKAMMGTGEADSEHRSIEAAEAAGYLAYTRFGRAGTPVGVQ